MPNQRTLARSFAGGEIAPELYGRMDLAANQTGLALCRNFIVLPHGPISNRAGFGFVRAVKDSSKRTRLIPFTFSVSQTFVLEFGPGYVRFHTNGATLVDGGGIPYEVATPFAEADLFDLHYIQSNDVLTLVHPNYPPKELRRLGPLSWTLTDISFDPTIGNPGGLTATANNVPTDATLTTYDYTVRAVAADTLEESAPAITPYVSCANDLSRSGSTNTITWDAVTGAERYNVYRRNGGWFSYIGQALGSPFTDDNITPDSSRTPPTPNNPFMGFGDYPAATSYFEQRRGFAGTNNKPQNVWLTRSATESNMSRSIPALDDDSLQFRIAAREANTIRHIVPLTDLIVLTASAEWRVTSGGNAALTSSNVNVRPLSYIGANNVQPPAVGNSILYAQARGGRVRELQYSFSSTAGYGYTNNDISILAPHLFDNNTIVDLAFVKAPYPMLWAVSSSGRLLGLTYVPEQKVAAWHRHETAGVFESVAAVSEGNEDALYAVVCRTVNGSSVRYVERMHTRFFNGLPDCFFVDAGLTYTGDPVNTVSGLDHLEGCTVAILADGAVLPQQVVTGGAITLDQPASTITVGLPYTAEAQLLPITLEAVQAFGQGRPKNVNKVFPRVHRTSGLFAGPSLDRMKEFKQRSNEPYGSPPRLIEDAELEIVGEPSWNQDGGVFLQQQYPLPATIVSVTLDVAVGG